MPTTFLSLPAPAANGSGAAVDVSGLAAGKTVVVEGNGGAFEPYVIIEFSNDNAALIWSPITMFSRPGEKTFTLACRWMRATVTNYRSGGAPVVNVGAEIDTALFAELLAPAGNGNGPGVDVSALAPFKTIQVSGPFKGTCTVEVSNDGGVTYSLATAFQGGKGGYTSMLLAAEFMRVNRTGLLVNEGSPGLPIVDIAAAAVGEPGPMGPPGPAGPAGAGAVLFWGVDNVGAAASTRFLPPGRANGIATTTDVYQEAMPRAGTLRNLFARHNSAGGAGPAVTYTVRVNGVATAIAVALATGAVGQAGNLVNTVAVAQGDRVSVSAAHALIGGGNIDVQVTLELA